MRLSKSSSGRPRLIVHIGARKTGTTYFQLQLGLNERRVAAAGVYLPKSGRFELNPANISHHHLAFQLQGNERFRPEQGGWEELKDEVDRRKPATVLITCEVFEDLIMEADKGSEVLDRFRTISDDITVVLVLRDWPSFVNSMYNQAIKMFAISHGFDEYVRNNIARGATKFVERYSPFLDADDVEFLAIPYANLQNPDPLSVIFSAAGIEIDPADLRSPAGRVNTSLGAIGLEVTVILGKYMKGLYPDWKWTTRPSQKLHIQNLVATDRRGWNREEYWGWSPELLAEAMPTIEADSNSFAQRLWGQDWPGGLKADKALNVSNFEHYPPDLMASSLDHIEEMHRLYLELTET
jgi:hypothetical protein